MRYINDIIENINKTNYDNYFIFGEGGIGKTTQLRRLYLCALNDSRNIIPFYLSVKDLPASEGENIFVSSVKEYCGSDVDVQELKNLLDGSSSLRKNWTFLFIIDGYNEAIDTVKKNLRDAIYDLSKFNKNIFVISSRTYDDAEIYFPKFKKLEVKPLDTSKVLKMLGSKAGLVNKSLINVLVVPIYLKYFLASYKELKNSQIEKLIRKSDILDSYLQVTIDNCKSSTTGNNWADVEFTVNYYLPALAFEMEQRGLVSCDNKTINKIKKAIDNNEYYEKFNLPTRKIDKYLASKPYNIAVENLSIFQEQDNSFTHQIWQEYFCAKYYVNCLQNDISEVFLNSLELETKGFIGEILKDEDGRCEVDFESKKDLTTVPSPIESYLQSHNLNSEEPLDAIQTTNLIEIMKACRHNHITADYSWLDLSKSDLSNVYADNSSFVNSQICSSVFYKFGHQKCYAVYDSDKQCFWLGDTVGQVFSLTKFNEQVLLFQEDKDEESNRILSIDVLSNNRLLIISQNHLPKIIDKYSGTIIQILQSYNLNESDDYLIKHERKDCYITNNEKHLVMTFRKMIYIWDLSNSEHINEGVKVAAIEFETPYNELKNFCNNLKGTCREFENARNQFENYYEQAVISESGSLLLAIKSEGFYSNSRREIELYDCKTCTKISTAYVLNGEVRAIFTSEQSFAFVENFKDADKSSSQINHLKMYDISSKEVKTLYSSNKKLGIFDIDSEHFSLNVNRTDDIIFNKKTASSEKHFLFPNYRNIRSYYYDIKNKLVFGLGPCRIVVLDYETGEEKYSLIHTQAISLTNHITCFSRKKNCYYVLFHGLIKVLRNDKNLSVIKTLCQGDDEGYAWCFALSNDETKLAVQNRECDIIFYDTDNQTELCLNIEITEHFSELHFICNDKKLLCKGEENLYIIDLTTNHINKSVRYPYAKTRKILKGNYLYRTKQLEEQTKIDVFNVSKNAPIISVNLQFSEWIGDIVYAPANKMLYIQYGLGEKTYAYDLHGNHLQSADIDCRGDFLLGSNDQIAFNFGDGLRVYSLSTQQLLAKNTSLFFASIANTDFSRAKFVGNEEEKKKFLDYIMKNGGLL